VAQAPTEARILTVPGDCPDANEAGPLQGPDGVAQAVVVGHGHQDAVGLELGPGDGEDPADLGPGQPIGEPVAQVTARAPVDREVRRVGDDQVDRAIWEARQQPLGRDERDTDAPGWGSGRAERRTVHGCKALLWRLEPEVALCPSGWVIAA
jgi:hypothetical protein